jgi:dolichol-phosphate mannosyltransferase
VKLSKYQPESEFDASIIVPTYCEADNLTELVPRIFQANQDVGIHCEVLVVDDASPDATENVCSELSKLYPIALIVRKSERGLSGAVLEGMRRSKGAVLVVIDADLSHPPEKIPQLVSELANGDADFAIGSRYVFGGSTDDKW